LRYRVVATGQHSTRGRQMAFAIGLLIFVGVIGSHVFLWWSCRRGGGSFRM
jgi:hypothetical protein